MKKAIVYLALAILPFSINATVVIYGTASTKTNSDGTIVVKCTSSSETCAEINMVFSPPTAIVYNPDGTQNTYGISAYRLKENQVDDDGTAYTEVYLIP